MEPSPPPSGVDSGSAFYRITLFGVLSGLCPLIPLPFVDDQCLRWVRKRMVSERLRRHGLKPTAEQVVVLAGAERDLIGGCWRAVLVLPFKITLYLVKKIFKKIIVLLTLKDCVDSFSHTFHEGYLLERALERGVLHPDWLARGRDGVTGLRWVIEETNRRVDPRPLNQLVKRAFRGSRGKLREAASLLGRTLRREGTATPGPENGPDPQVVQQEEALLGGFLDRLTAALLGEKGYLEALEKRFDEVLAEARARS